VFVNKEQCGSPSALLVAHARELNLHAVHAVDAVHEQDQDEDERDLHAILQFGHDGALRDEGEELAAPGERQRDDEGKEDEHLRHQEEEDLQAE
jgi:hypothetical protein